MSSYDAPIPAQIDQPFGITTKTPTGTTVTIDWDLGDQILDLGSASGGPVVVTFTNVRVGGRLLLRVIQASPALGITFPTINWQKSQIPALSPADDAIDNFTFKAWTTTDIDGWQGYSFGT